MHFENFLEVDQSTEKPTEGRETWGGPEQALRQVLLYLGLGYIWLPGQEGTLHAQELLRKSILQIPNFTLELRTKANTKYFLAQKYKRKTHP